MRGLEMDPYGAQFRVVEVNGLENSELRLGIFEQLERWERNGFYRCRRFVLRPTPLVTGRRRLPKFDLVSFWIDDPGKLPVLGIVDLVENVAAFFA